MNPSPSSPLSVLNLVVNLRKESKLFFRLLSVFIGPQFLFWDTGVTCNHPRNLLRLRPLCFLKFTNLVLDIFCMDSCPLPFLSQVNENFTHKFLVGVSPTGERQETTQLRDEPSENRYRLSPVFPLTNGILGRGLER